MPAARSSRAPPNGGPPAPGNGPPRPDGAGRFASTTATPISGGARKLDDVDARHRVARRLLPIRVADVRLIHHVTPLAAGQLRVVAPRDLGVPIEESARAVGELVRHRASLERVLTVLGDGDVQVGEIRQRLDRVEHDLVVGVADIRAAIRLPMPLGATAQAVVLARRRVSASR